MRRNTFFASAQHTLPFARHDIWQSIPAEHRCHCRALCRQLLQAVLQYEEVSNPEEDHEREDSRRTS
jgi:hypothetical protein